MLRAPRWPFVVFGSRGHCKPGLGPFLGIAAACGASRLDGGMHFTGAVAAGEELCKGIGTAGFEYASDLIGGEW